MNIQPILDAFPVRSNRGILNLINKEATEKALHLVLAQPAEAAKALADKLLDPHDPGSDVQARHVMHATAIRIPALDQNARKAYSEALAAALADELPAPTATSPSPEWSYEAHRHLGEADLAGGRRAQALAHFQRYLVLAPQAAIDRPEVEARVETLGG